MKGTFEIEVYEENGVFLKQEERPSSILGKADRKLSDVAETYFELYPDATCVEIRVMFQKEPT